MKLLSTCFLIMLFFQSRSQECRIADRYKTSYMSETLDSAQMEIPLYFTISQDSIIASPSENGQGTWMALKILSKQCFQNERPGIDKVVFKTSAHHIRGTLYQTVTINLLDSSKRYIEIVHNVNQSKFFLIEKIVTAPIHTPTAAHITKSALITNTQLVKEGLLYSDKIKSSIEFWNCANLQLTDLFIKQTGLKPGKNLSFSISNHWIGQPLVEPGDISKLNINLYVNHNWNPVVVLWRSKSGRVYKIDDIDIDCNDIRFWFDKLDTELYISQLYPGDQKLPFVIKDLPFELQVTRLNMDCSLLLTVKEAYRDKREAMIEAVYDFIGKFNTASEEKDREEGVVHNYKGEIKDANVVAFEIDLGSVGYDFFKKLLKFLATIKGIQKVEIA
jgi:hypothetical protein